MTMLSSTFVHSLGRGYERIQSLTKNVVGEGLSSKEILQRLHQLTRLIRGSDIRWTYDELNDKIIKSL